MLQPTRSAALSTELRQYHRLQCPAGVCVQSGRGDSILSNSIYSNEQPVSYSRPPALRPGPNDLQAAPDLTGAQGGGATSAIQGTLTSVPKTSFLIQFFTNQVPDPSGYGQGQTLLGATTVTTNGQGYAAFVFAPSSSLAGGTWLTATATRLNTVGNTVDTSEFSNAIAPLSLQFKTAAITVDATAGYAFVDVQRLGDPNGTVAVNYATSNGTAVAGKDYTAASGTLTFPSNATDEIFSVAILPNSSQTASSVTVNLALSNPTAGSTLGSPSTAVLTVDNNMPPVLQFSSSTYSTSYGPAVTLITVVRSGGTHSSMVQVNYATAGGSAVPGTDYTPVSGTLTFLANQTTATFTMPILQGGNPAATRTVGLLLSNPAYGAQLGALSTATLSITPGSPYNPVGPTNPTPPQIAGEQLVLGPAGIMAVQFTFSLPLNSSRVPDLGNYGYYVDVAGAGGKFGTSSDTYIPLSSAQYNAAIIDNHGLSGKRFASESLRPNHDQRPGQPTLEPGIDLHFRRIVIWVKQRRSWFSVRRHLRRRVIAGLHRHVSASPCSSVCRVEA